MVSRAEEVVHANSVGLFRRAVFFVPISQNGFGEKSGAHVHAIWPKLTKRRNAAHTPPIRTFEGTMSSTLIPVTNRANLSDHFWCTAAKVTAYPFSAPATALTGHADAMTDRSTVCSEPRALYALGSSPHAYGTTSSRSAASLEVMGRLAGGCFGGRCEGRQAP